MKYKIGDRIIQTKPPYYIGEIVKVWSAGYDIKWKNDEAPPTWFQYYHQDNLENGYAPILLCSRN